MIHKSLARFSGVAAVSVLLAGPAVAMDVTPATVAAHYSDIALATYQDALDTAVELDGAIGALVATPNAETLDAARAAWIAARVPYQQTEAYRFGNPLVDEWEGRVNAWPLDEGLIDYVDTSYGVESDANDLYVGNVVANAKLMINGSEVDVSEITPQVISEVLHEAGQVEANVASGYHAIEFLLWGQDLNGTEPGAGSRAATDFDTNACTNGNCERRAQYLTAASTLLVDDLKEMVAAWSADGAARQNVSAQGDKGIATILTGMGSLSYGELAGERMKLGLLLHDPEEEHDCFSDNTHASHFNDIQGIANVYYGSYARVSGDKVSGPSLAALLEKTDPALAKEMDAKLQATLGAARAMVARAEAGEAYDQMIGEGNEVGNGIVQAVIDGLVDQTATIERVVVALGLENIEIEGSDSLDDPNAVFQ